MKTIIGSVLGGGIVLTNSYNYDNFVSRNFHTH